MTQPEPKYPTMTIGAHPEIHNHLRKKYGVENVCWPILVYDLDTKDVDYLIIEVNAKNNVNREIREPLLGPAPFPEYKLDYTISPRHKMPIPLSHKIPWKGSTDILSAKYNSSYEFVTQHGGIYTIDVDYVWKKPNGELFGLETSTFYMDMRTEKYAEYLVQKFIETRVSRRGAHHLHVLARAASKIGIQMSLVFFNVLGHSNIIKTDGYAYSIPLNITTAQEMHSGVFVKGKYLTFSDWLNSL
ncbi:MAG: hypothetical protein OEY88_08900 [Candidatus Bathyarchaeota archaeon]|nr:hypothetical protein [Candidatus Bathyarchaeota archaeon]